MNNQPLFSQFYQQGAAFPIEVLTQQEAAHHRACLEQVESRLGRSLHYMVKPYLFCNSARELAFHPKLLDAVEQVLGPDLLLWDGAYVIKEPASKGFISWHQDLTYWGLSGEKMVTAWLALTPANPHNGGMSYLPQSHLGGMIRHQNRRSEDNILYHGQDASDNLDTSAEQSMDLEAGQCSFHHGWTLHASKLNESDDRRIGLSLQYISTDMMQVESVEDFATLVRGHDRFGHFSEDPQFFSDLSEEAMAAQRKIERLKHEVYERQSKKIQA